MGGFLGIGGRQAADYNTAQKGISSLNNVFNFGMKRADALSTTGTGTTATGVDTATSALPSIRSGAGSIQDSINYFKNLTSGNRTATAQAVAPETNALQQQEAARRRQLAATGTARGGGVAAVNEEAKTRQMTDINNSIFGVRPQSAQALTQAGAAETSAGATAGGLGLGIAGVGTTESQLGLGAAGLSGQAAQNVTADALKSREDSYQIARQQTSDVLKLIFG